MYCLAVIEHSTICSYEVRMVRVNVSLRQISITC